MSLIPFTDPEDCAEIIIEGVQRGKRHIFVPKMLEPLFRLGNILPHKVTDALDDFLGCGVGAHD